METNLCRKCNTVKPLSEFRKYPNKNLWRHQCKECERAYGREYSRNHRSKMIERTRNWRHINGIHAPMDKNKKCSSYLGVHIAENILSKYFENVTRTKYGTKGYDFICSKGYKIDVKSSCIVHKRDWSFHINNNKIADYFLCLAFDNREDLHPKHIWLIPSDIINKLSSLTITNSDKPLLKWKKYEKDVHKLEILCTSIQTGTYVL